LRRHSPPNAAACLESLCCSEADYSRSEFLIL
jgi:hypothetical protein